MIVLSISLGIASVLVGYCSPPLLPDPNGKPVRDSLLLYEEPLSTFNLQLAFVTIHCHEGEWKAPGITGQTHPWPSLSGLVWSSWFELLCQSVRQSRSCKPGHSVLSNWNGGGPFQISVVANDPWPNSG